MKLSMDVQHYHEYEYANADIIMSMIFSLRNYNVYS